MKRIYIGFLTALCLFLTVPQSLFADEAAPPTDPLKVLGLKFSGDIRFRTEYFVQDQDYSPTHINTPPQWIDHEFRFRIKGSLGVVKSFGEEATAGLGLSTGNGADPAEPNLTLSNGANLKNFNLNRAFIDWTPGFLDHRLSLTVGKMENPLARTPITWDEDISPEGAALSLEATKDTRFTVLYCILQENGPALVEGNGVDLFIAQFQLQQKFSVADANVALTAGYQYVPFVSAYMTGDPALGVYQSDPTNPPGAPLSITAKGMVGDQTAGGLIPDMHILEGMLTVAHNIGEEKIPVAWTLHGAYNLTSFNLTALTNANIAVNHPGANDSNALALFAQVAVGRVARQGDWYGSLEWGIIEPNAVFSAFSDSDSGVGHNNNTWFKGVVETGLSDGLTLSLGQYLDWRANYDVFATTPSNIFGTTSRSPVLRTQIDLKAKL